MNKNVLVSALFALSLAMFSCGNRATADYTNGENVGVENMDMLKEQADEYARQLTEAVELGNEEAIADVQQQISDWENTLSPEAAEKVKLLPALKKAISLSATAVGADAPDTLKDTLGI